MVNLNNYILEKLKIDKNIHVKDQYYIVLAVGTAFYTLEEDPKEYTYRLNKRFPTIFIFKQDVLKNDRMRELIEKHDKKHGTGEFIKKIEIYKMPEKMTPEKFKKHYNTLKILPVQYLKTLEKVDYEDI